MDITAREQYQNLNEALKRVYVESAGDGAQALFNMAQTLKARYDTSGVTPEEVAFVKSFLMGNSSVKRTFDQMSSQLSNESRTAESYLESGMSLNEAGILPFVQKTAEGLFKIFFDILKGLVTGINKGLEAAFKTRFGKQLGMGVIVLFFVDIATQSMAVATQLKQMGFVGEVLLAFYEPAAAAVASLGPTVVGILALALLVLFIVYVAKR